MIQPTFINVHLDEYSQEFYYYPYAFEIDRCAGRCNTLNDLSNKACVLNKSKCFQHDYRNKWIKNIKLYHANVKVNLIE